MSKASRIKAAEDTLQYFKQGYYIIENRKVNIEESHEKSIKNSFLITPEDGELYVEELKNNTNNSNCEISVVNVPTVKAVLLLTGEKLENIGVLNFASARNPGGGFLKGSLAQEESIATASGLYYTQIKNEKYYEFNRENKTMMYSDYMIYSKEVVFIRDENLNLLKKPVTASIITAPAVNYGQVILKNEDKKLANYVMKNRMRKILAVFAKENNRNIILGAYGCGVFRNEPEVIARYFKGLLYEEKFINYFDKIVFAVYDTSKDQRCLKAFENII